MQENSHPLAILYGYQSNRNELSFVGRKGIITLSGRSAKIDKILRLCNGMTSFHDIVEQSPSVNPKEIFELLSLCEKQGIVRDSRELYIGFHEDSANPTTFSHDLGSEDVALIMTSERLRERKGKVFQLPQSENSGVLNIIRKRQSARQFQNSPISGGKLLGLLEATYSVGKNGHWSVPSGGALYPLDLYLIVPGNNQALPLGIYRWNPEKSEMTMISDKDPNVWLFKVFNVKALLENAACILCLAADLRRPALKYANRGYRNTLLEVGHAAQNTYLYCAEQNIGIVEYVGFCERALAEKLLALVGFSRNDFNEIIAYERPAVVPLKLTVDKLVFQYLLNKYKIAPRDAYMIGDEYEFDLLPAKTLGINTIEVRHKSDRADHFVANILDLPTYLTSIQ